jgi:hypothetical protein
VSRTFVIVATASRKTVHAAVIAARLKNRRLREGCSAMSASYHGREGNNEPRQSGAERCYAITSSYSRSMSHSSDLTPACIAGVSRSRPVRRLVAGAAVRETCGRTCGADGRPTTTETGGGGLESRSGASGRCVPQQSWETRVDHTTDGPSCGRGRFRHSKCHILTKNAIEQYRRIGGRRWRTRSIFR